jgi:hypothetical protein
MSAEGIALFGNVGLNGENIKVTKDNGGAWWEIGTDTSDVSGNYRIPASGFASVTLPEVKADNYRLYINDILFDEKFIPDEDWDAQP